MKRWGGAIPEQTAERLDKRAALVEAMMLGWMNRGSCRVK
jgi:hypothetical protein